MNNSNLVPMGAQTESKQREIARNGGIASGIAKRQKKEARKMAAALLENFVDRPITAALIKEMNARLLAMTDDQLQAVIADNDLPTYARTCAQLLAQPDKIKAFEVSEKMIDRAFGKTKQEIDTKMFSFSPVILMDDGLDDIVNCESD